jgi:predicted N-acetyltransferase YhbS
MTRADNGLTLIAPDAARHAEQVYDLTGRVFSHGGYFEWVERSRKGWGGGMYDWGASTVGFLGTEMVTHWGVWGYEMRVGSARLRTAGIGGVATHGFHRKEGLMSRTIAAAMPRMKASGYDVSILFGIPDYYHKFGYVPAWETPVYVVDCKRLPEGPPPAGVRRSRQLMTPEMEALYNRQTANLAGMAVRPTRRCPVHFVSDRQTYVWRDGQGRLAGYVMVGLDQGKPGHVDSAGDPEQILRALAGLARRAGAAEVRFGDLHWDSPLARHLRAGFCRLELQFSRSGGAMIRTLNLASSLAKLCPEFSRLLQGSDMASWRGALRIEDAREAVTLGIERGRVAIEGATGAKHPCSSDPAIGTPTGAAHPRHPTKSTRHVLRGGEHVAQLLIGTHEPGQVMADGKMKASGDAAGLAQVLFPARNPMLALWDHY